MRLIKFFRMIKNDRSTMPMAGFLVMADKGRVAVGLVVLLGLKVLILGICSGALKEEATQASPILKICSKDFLVAEGEVAPADRNEAVTFRLILKLVLPIQYLVPRGKY